MTKKKDKKVVAINRKEVMKKDMKEIRSRRMTEESKIEKRKSWRERERENNNNREKEDHKFNKTHSKTPKREWKRNGKTARDIETGTRDVR